MFNNIIYIHIINYSRNNNYRIRVLQNRYKLSTVHYKYLTFSKDPLACSKDLLYITILQYLLITFIYCSLYF